MAVAFLIEIPGMTAEQGAAVLRELGVTNDKTVPGQLAHIEGPMEGGFRVVDVWESQEVFDAFVGSQLAPAFQRVGLTLPPDMRPTLAWQVTGILK